MDPDEEIVGALPGNKRVMCERHELVHRNAGA
jgi:hypothetical protein